MIARSEARTARSGVDSFTASDGIRLGYCIDDFTDPWKEAPALLLLHAAMGSARRYYAWVPPLSRNYRVVRMDLRDPARRLAVLQPRRGAEQHQAAHPFATVHRQLLAEITASRIADDMRIGAIQMVHQLGDVAHQPVQGKLAIGGRYLRAAVAAQIHPHYPVMPAERRDPGIIAARAAHRSMQ